jgi:hypothetical protein
MTTSRYLHTATLLSDGRVLIAGGQTGLHPWTSSADPFQPTFTSSAGLYEPSVPQEARQKLANAFRLSPEE